MPVIEIHDKESRGIGRVQDGCTYELYHFYKYNLSPTWGRFKGCKLFCAGLDLTRKYTLLVPETARSLTEKIMSEVSSFLHHKDNNFNEERF